jgi:hypothetical protein
VSNGARGAGRSNGRFRVAYRCAQGRFRPNRTPTGRVSAPPPLSGVGAIAMTRGSPTDAHSATPGRPKAAARGPHLSARSGRSDESSDSPWIGRQWCAEVVSANYRVGAQNLFSNRPRDVVPVACERKSGSYRIFAVIQATHSARTSFRNRQVNLNRLSKSRFRSTKRIRQRLIWATPSEAAPWRALSPRVRGPPCEAL